MGLSMKLCRSAHSHTPEPHLQWCMQCYACNAVHLVLSSQGWACNAVVSTAQLKWPGSSKWSKGFMSCILRHYAILTVGMQRHVHKPGHNQA